MPVKGIKRVKTNFRLKVKDIAENKTRSAVYAILLQGSAIAATMTPIDTSYLINSAYGPLLKNVKFGIMGEVGYSAAYAYAVHEAPGKLKGKKREDFGKTQAGVSFGGGTGVGYYWEPNAEPKFLQKGFEELKPSIPAILKAIYAN